jgi:hypothetical protein
MLELAVQAKLNGEQVEPQANKPKGEPMGNNNGELLAQLAQLAQLAFKVKLVGVLQDSKEVHHGALQGNKAQANKEDHHGAQVAPQAHKELMVLVVNMELEPKELHMANKAHGELEVALAFKERVDNKDSKEDHTELGNKAHGELLATLEPKELHLGNKVHGELEVALALKEPADNKDSKEDHTELGNKAHGVQGEAQELKEPVGSKDMEGKDHLELKEQLAFKAKAVGALAVILEPKDHGEHQDSKALQDNKGHGELEEALEFKEQGNMGNKVDRLGELEEVPEFKVLANMDSKVDHHGALLDSKELQGNKAHGELEEALEFKAKAVGALEVAQE